jgi:murein tripeptide amidase MpaA
VFITARVHCGEIPASYFLQGMIDFLMEDEIQSQVLLDNFVFKIIPMLNPDGVSRGYWRNDTQALNLNRCYSNASKDLHPSIYAAKE